jgi:hypothetical protein
MFQLISHRTEEALTVRIARDRLLRELYQPVLLGHWVQRRHWWPAEALGAYGKTEVLITSGNW